MSSVAIVQGLGCAVNLTPNCLTAEVPSRGNVNAGKLVLGVIVKPSGGILCGDDGLQLDCCAIQACQFKKKFTEVFAPPVVFRQGLVP